MYSQGNYTRVRVLTYAGEEKIILTTEIKLKLFGQVLHLSFIEEDLNNGSGFLFPTFGDPIQGRPSPPTLAKSPSFWAEIITNSSHLKKSLIMMELLFSEAKFYRTS